MNEYELQMQEMNPETAAESEQIKPSMHNISFNYENEVPPDLYGNIDSSDEETEDEKNQFKLPRVPLRFLIIDCSAINFIDTVGVKAIKQVT